MAKYWDGEYNINTNWGGDASTEGKPLTGEMVQTVIKDELKRLDKGKVGYIEERDGTVYFSSSKEDYDGEKYMGSVISTQRYTMSLEEDRANRYVFLSNDADKKYVWYFKSIEIASDSVFKENVTVEYIITNQTNTTSKTISMVLDYDGKEEFSGFTQVTVNLDEYLVNGVTSLEIRVKGLRSKQEGIITRSITILTLDIEDITNFSSPCENDGLLVETKVNCINGQPFSYYYRIDDNEYQSYGSFTGAGYNKTENMYLNVADLSDGVHVLEYSIYTNIGADLTHHTSTQRVEFIKGENYVFDEPQVLIFSEYTSKEIIGDDGNLIVYGATQYVPFEVKCSVYNTSIDATNVEFYEVTSDGDTILASTTIENGSTYKFVIQSMDYGMKTIKVVCKDSDNNILNGEGRIFHINIDESTLKISEYKTNRRIKFSSVGKSNNSIDKDVWISNIPENNFTNTAKFSENFDWSQGWTKDGLVLSKDCEVEFDYAPFPYQDGTNKNDYVGGDKPYTLEIEFMTQNVTDESAVLCNMIDEKNPTVGRGLLITGSEIKFVVSGDKAVSSRFKEGDINRAVIVIDPKGDADNFKGLVKLYMNGVLTNVVPYSYNDRFEVLGEDENGNFSSKKLKFTGQDGADIVLKHVNAFRSPMSNNDVVDNYIIYRDDAMEMLELYSKNDILNDQGQITPESIIEKGNIPVLIFVGRMYEDELATGDGNTNGFDGDPEIYPGGYIRGKVDAAERNTYKTLEATSDKKETVHMDVIYYNPDDKTKNFKLVKAYITPQGTSSMYYPKKNYRIYTQKNDDTRMFLSKDENNVLELDQMLISNFGEEPEHRIFEVHRGTKNKKKRLYSFKNNAQAVKCWCLKADFAETSSSHNTGIARLWGETLRNATVTIDNNEYSVFKTNAQQQTEDNYKTTPDKMPDVRTTIDGFPIVVFGRECYSGATVFLGKYNFNNDKSTESVFGFCDIDNNPEHAVTDKYCDYENNISGTSAHTLDEQLDQYMTCVETLDNGNALANFSETDSWYEITTNSDGDEVEGWMNAFEFRYPEIPEAPKAKDYQDESENWLPADEDGKTGEDRYNEDKKEFEEETYPYWVNTHLKPFKHFADWLYSTRWCDVNGNILEDELRDVLNSNTNIVDESGNTITTVEGLAEYRKRKFSVEKWQHIDVWKMSAYYIYLMRFGAVDQVVKNSMLTSEGPFACNKNGEKYGELDKTDEKSEIYGRYYKWYYINYDNDTIMGVKNDGSLKYGPEITRQDLEGGEGSKQTSIYAGSTSTLWNNIEQDDEFQEIITKADKGISRTLTYKAAIDMFNVKQVGEWCERIYNEDAEYKYISPYMAGWEYDGEDKDEVEDFSNKLFMLQGSRTAHRKWWLSRRFNLFDGKWSSGDFATKFVEVKCNYGEIGNTFSAIAGSNAYFGYQINNRTFGSPEGGDTTKYNANETINWTLKKVINIGDPIAIYGSNDLLELNLQGISSNLTSVLFRFGTNEDLGNKLERFIISIPEDELMSTMSYKSYSDDDKNADDYKSGFEKLKEEHKFYITTEEVFAETYPTLDKTIETEEITVDSPKYYRVKVTSENGDVSYVYYAKYDGGLRNYACSEMSFDTLDKLQVLGMAGYMGVPDINLSRNSNIREVDVRYSAINTINFGTNSQIEVLKASDKLSSLVFNNCGRIKMQNIFINSSTLKEDGGKNILTIDVQQSPGLNSSGDFKDFIVKWMKSGKITAKELVLKGINWKNVRTTDMETIMKFVFGDENGKKPLKCLITGHIDLAKEKITNDELIKYDRLCEAMGGQLTYKMPYANIILNPTKKSVVAGESAEYGYTLFPDKSIIDKGGVIEFEFVKEVSSGEEYNYFDSKTNKYYKLYEDGETARDGVSVNVLNNDKVIINTVENVVGSDTEVLLIALLKHNGETTFDVAPLLVKEPTYAVDGVISGLKNINAKNTPYSYTLSILSNVGEEPIGTTEIEWSVYGENVEKYLSTYEVSDDNKTITIVTSNEQPDPTGNVYIKATVKNGEASKDIVPSIPSAITIEKELLLLNENVVLTEETNPIVFNICKAQGWASYEKVMTKDEAESITNIGTVFSGVKSDEGWSFEEFMYFTNVKLNQLSESAFENSDITSIVLPQNITSIGKNAFANCPKLKNVELNNSITIIPDGCFLNCTSLSNFNLPDSITHINKFAFGGTGIDKIIDKTSTYIDGNRAILVSLKTSSLLFIRNNAFEIENWEIDVDTKLSNSTNPLRQVYLPKNLQLAEDAYNFTLGNNLTKIVVDDESGLAVVDNILYANIEQTTLVRAIPKANEENVITNAFAEYVWTVYPYAFYRCETIKNISFGNSLEQYGLGIGVFCESSIEIVDLSRCVLLESIKEYTFANCKKLREVSLPVEGNLKTLGTNLFSNCMELSAITLSDTIEEFEGDSNAGDSNTFVNCGIEELILPKSLKKTGRFFANKCQKLKRVVFPEMYKSVGSGGSDKITDCSALEEVVLPIFSYTDSDGNDVIVNDYLENDATPFVDCFNIKRYVFSENDNNKLFVLSNGIIYRVGYIGDGEYAGKILSQDKELHAVPTGLSEIAIDSDTKIIGTSCMRGCKSLKNVVIPEGVTRIKSTIFTVSKPGSSTSSYVESVILPKSLTTLEGYAFDWCVMLKNIIVPENITEINHGVFRRCESLERVTLLGNITKIERFAFNNCSKLGEIILMAQQAPVLGYDNSNGTYDYHPFGYKKLSSTYVGVDSDFEQNILYVPYGHVGYDAYDWVNPLQDSDICGFIVKEIPIKDTYIYINAKYSDGTIMSGETLYLYSESGKLVFDDGSVKTTATFIEEKQAYEVYLNGNVYHNEKVDIYTDEEKTKPVGQIIIKYGVDHYEVGGGTVLSSPRKMFSSNIFGTTSNTVSKTDEPIQITKSEYAKLISKINQLTEIINKLK